MLNPEQLVQDVINGSESPLVGFAVLSEEIERLQACLNEIQPAALREIGMRASQVVHTRRTAGVIVREGENLEYQIIKHN